MLITISNSGSRCDVVYILMILFVTDMTSLESLLNLNALRLIDFNQCTNKNVNETVSKPDSAVLALLSGMN